MFCNKCGKNLSERSKFCPFCGAGLQSGMTEQQMWRVAGAHRRKPIPKFFLFMLLPIIIVIILSIMPEEERHKSETIEKLLRFTDIESGEDAYAFTYKDTVVGDSLKDWRLMYVPENEFVILTDDKVVSCFTAQFERDCLKNSWFSYNLDTDEIGSYFDVEIEEGNLSIINYSVDEDEFTLIVNGEQYGASDKLIRFMNSYDIPEILVDDIERVKEELVDNGVSFDEIANLTYQDIAEYVENTLQTASKEEEERYSEKEEYDTARVEPAADEEMPDPEEQEVSDPGYFTNIEDIRRYPNKYMGTVVKVSGIIDDYRRLHEGSQTNMLIGAFPYEPQPLEGDHITVIGVVQKDFFGDMAMSIKDFCIN
ncbi:MAG: zinc ribbon domain-containing protein [Lachnospiraceae bacterium]|nr:zinc ribbon domain-containing protein [Lachnospiraceae bacterium]